MARIVKVLGIGLSALLLVACGGSEKPVPPSSDIDVSVRTNRIALSWNSVIAGEYNLYRDDDGAEGPNDFELYGNLPSYAESLNIAASVHLYAWEDEKQFYLEGCNLNGCARSDTFTIFDDYNLDATGYFKASNAAVGKADNFGASIGIDAAGAMLVVGSPLEDSSSTGTVLGDGSLAGQPIDDRTADGYELAPESGAVYAYAINSFGQWVQLNYLKAPDLSTSADTVDAAAAAVAAQNEGGAGDWFGRAVAISGNGLYLAVGAPREDGGCAAIDEDQCTDPVTDNSSVDSGAVFIYEKISSQWVLVNYIKPEVIIAGAEFGAALSFNEAGNTLAIGAPNNNIGDSGIFNDDEVPDTSTTVDGSGAVYVLVRTGTDDLGDPVWELQALIKSPAIAFAEGDKFGSTVALSDEGNTLAIAAPYENGSNAGVFNASESMSDSFLNDSVGAVYVYSRDSFVVDDATYFDWVYQAYLKPPVNEDNMLFGKALDFSVYGDDLLVGAPNAALGQGAAYLYTRASGEWDSAITTFDANSLLDGDPANGEAGDAFGASVALVSLASLVDLSTLDSDAYAGMVAIGAPGEDGSARGVLGLEDNNANDTGAVYLFLQSPVDLEWRRSRYIKAPNTMPGSEFEFGAAVSLSGFGTSMAVSAPSEPVASGGIGADPDRDDPSDAANQNADAPGAGAVYLY
ncbi:MAG: hypothetical protein P8M26_10675 [Gammaproteobacteria bacterium]|nr:hypothetical protein [Gammaproteobacteria bacterium]